MNSEFTLLSGRDSLLYSSNIVNEIYLIVLSSRVYCVYKEWAFLKCSTL